MKKIFSLLLVAVCFHVQAALADPFLTASVFGNNQVIGPMDTASFIIRLTNTGDAPLVWSNSSGSIGPYFGQYSLIADAPPATGTLAVGGFVDLMTSFEPFLPVPLGQYDSPFNYYFFGPGVLLPSVGGTMYWTVAAATVPEPTSLALLGIGLIALVAFRRRNV